MIAYRAKATLSKRSSLCVARANFPVLAAEQVVSIMSPDAAGRAILTSLLHLLLKLLPAVIHTRPPTLLKQILKKKLDIFAAFIDPLVVCPPEHHLVNEPEVEPVLPRHRVLA